VRDRAKRDDDVARENETLRAEEGRPNVWNTTLRRVRGENRNGEVDGTMVQASRTEKRACPAIVLGAAFDFPLSLFLSLSRVMRVA